MGWIKIYLGPAQPSNIYGSTITSCEMMQVGWTLLTIHSFIELEKSLPCHAMDITIIYINISIYALPLLLNYYSTQYNLILFISHNHIILPLSIFIIYTHSFIISLIFYFTPNHTYPTPNNALFSPFPLLMQSPSYHTNIVFIMDKQLPLIIAHPIFIQ